MTQGLPDGRNMWIRAFYDFNPEEAGYVGWTMESGQARALRELKDGDLMMIYGASSGQTKKATRDGAIAIDLIDGDRLCELLKENRLGVATEMIERVQIEANWFDGI